MSESTGKPAKAWGGVFTEATDSRMEKFSESISFDSRMHEQDIRGSIAHARMLADVGILTADEFAAIERGLTAIEERIVKGDFEYSISKEDIHMHVESALIEKLGDVGRKLHTARSRNDQVSTDFRLWIRDAIDRLDVLLADLQRAFVGRCDGDFDVVVPAYTHTQRAQPVLAPHIWLAYVEKLRLILTTKRILLPIRFWIIVPERALEILQFSTVPMPNPMPWNVHFSAAAFRTVSLVAIASSILLSVVS